MVVKIFLRDLGEDSIFIFVLPDTNDLKDRVPLVPSRELWVSCDPCPGGYVGYFFPDSSMITFRVIGGKKLRCHFGWKKVSGSLSDESS